MWVQTDSFLVCCCVQVLWCDMDEILAELFTPHLSTSNFNGNPTGTFSACIGRSEYDPDETPWSIELYGAWYTIVVSLGECVQGYV